MGTRKAKDAAAPPLKHSPSLLQWALKLSQRLLFTWGFFFPPSKLFSHSQGRGGKPRQAVPEPGAASSEAGGAPDTQGVKSKLESPPASAGFKNRKRTEKTPLIFPHQFNWTSFQVLGQQLLSPDLAKAFFFSFTVAGLQPVPGRGQGAEGRQHGWGILLSCPGQILPGSTNARSQHH